MEPIRITASLNDPFLRNPPMLTTCLQAAWFWADEPLRTALEGSIRALVSRSPAILPVIKTTLRSYAPPPRHLLNPSDELTGLLLSLWALGDPPLRAEAEAMILSYAARHKGFAASLAALVATSLNEQRGVGAMGYRDTTEAQLNALLRRLQPDAAR